jgi:hypothetical protein
MGKKLHLLEASNDDGIDLGVTEKASLRKKQTLRITE